MKHSTGNIRLSNAQISLFFIALIVIAASVALVYAISQTGALVGQNEVELIASAGSGLKWDLYQGSDWIYSGY